MTRSIPARVHSLLAVAALVAGGCAGGQERYIPEGEQARGAVESALTSWKAGEPHMTIVSHDPPVDLFDARRQAGRKLADFKIIETIPGDPHPSFRVSMKFAGGTESEETTYLVMGIDPLLVFRAEDYKRATGM